MKLVDDPNLHGDIANEVRELQTMIDVIESKHSLVVRLYLELYPALISEDPAKQDKGLQRLRQVNAIMRTGHLQFLSDMPAYLITAAPLGQCPAFPPRRC